jgi:hypothetical protein
VRAARYGWHRQPVGNNDGGDFSDQRTHSYVDERADADDPLFVTGGV